MSRLWYLVGLLPLAAGIALCVHFVFALRDDIRDMQRVDVPGEHELYLEPGEYVIYAEGGTVSAQCAMVDDTTGEPVTLELPTGKTTYAMFGHSGQNMFEMTIPREGGYHLACEGGPGTLAIGHGIGLSIVAIGLAPVGGVLLTAIARAIVATLRSRRKKVVSSPPPWAVAR